MHHRRSTVISRARLVVLAVLTCAALLWLSSCAKKSGDGLVDPPPSGGSTLFRTLGFGTPNNLELITWNVRTFPLDEKQHYNVDRVRYLVQALRAIDADIVCLQEIMDRSAFWAVDDSLAGYEGYIRPGSGSFNLAILYKSSTVSEVNFEELYTNLSQPFPRPPLKMTATFAGQRYVVIDNHFKCCGDGQIDLADPGDQESRRAEASRLLQEYIAAELPNERVIVVGDLNDRLNDAPRDNVFQVFFDQPATYRFADYELATGPSSEFSWVGSSGNPAQFDHILVTDELFAAINGSGALVVTLKPEADLVGGINEYREKLSDHRPVALRIAP